MRIIARKTLKEFWTKHPQAQQPLQSWFAEAQRACWQTPQEIKDVYRSADILPSNRVVFNVGGNKYRLIVHINYSLQIVFIRFVGTHAQYDKIKAETV